MTENLAGRGEGLKGLVAKLAERWEAVSKYTSDRGYKTALISCAGELRRTAEAAAPPSTAPGQSIESLENARRWCFSMRQDEWLGDAIQELQSWKPAALYRVVAALATPSPQAPAGDRTFSPTELTHLRMATASDSPECICHIERLGNFGHYKRWRDKNCLVHGEKAKEGK